MQASCISEGAGFLFGAYNDGVYRYNPASNAWTKLTSVSARGRVGLVQDRARRYRPVDEVERWRSDVQPTCAA